jgi:Zn-dependent protease
VLVEPERSPYDVHFRALGFPVRVHPWFWIALILFNGNGLLRRGPEFLLLWGVVVFVSLLVHELGHALAYRRFGAYASIVLYAFGGLAIASSHIPGRWRRIVVSLAGPAAGFTLCGIVYLSNLGLEWGESADHRATYGPEPQFFYRQLIFVNLYWGLFNLLPVYPLDGGQVARELCQAKWATRGKRISLRLSFGVALVVVAYSLLCVVDLGQFGSDLIKELPTWLPEGTIFPAILFGVLAYESYRLLRRVEWTDTHWDDRLPWER